MKHFFPVSLLAFGLLIMMGGAAIVLVGGNFRGMWTVVAITIVIGFVTTNFGRVGLVDDEDRRDQSLRAAVCAVVHLSFAVMLLFFIGGASRGPVGIQGEALGIAGLILPLSLLCVAVSLCQCARLHLGRSERYEEN